MEVHWFFTLLKYMFSRVWETERLITDPYLKVGKDRENSNGESDLLEFDQKKGVNFPPPSQIYSMGGSWVPGLQSGPEYHFFLENRTVFGILDSRELEG